MLTRIKEKLTNYQIIAIAYLFIILIGGVLLCLPISSKSGVATPFLNSLFTSTSATCVTGLIIYDTYAQWSIFGQLVILLLIQIGGIGFMTIMTLLSLVLKKRISLSEKSLLLQTTGDAGLNSVGKLIKQICLGTLLFESLGAVLLAIRFALVMPVGQAIYTAVFTSVSAFCNAGFDLMGVFGEFSSLVHFAGDVVVNLTVMFLIVTGGLGFLVWSDILSKRQPNGTKKLTLHSIMVLIATGALIVIGAVLFGVFEWNHSLQGMPVGTKILASLFQSVTPRTAGFNTVDLTKLSGSGQALIVILMFIGGNSGSTAGGIKVTTFVVLLLTITSNIRRKSGIIVGKRKLEDNVIPQAAAIVMLYLTSIIAATLIMGAIEPMPFDDVLFEVVSAVGTVGLTKGITPFLTVASKIILMMLMYSGRVGMLSLVMVFATKNVNVPLERPTEKIIVG